jgi:hypothetical protein
LAGADLGPEQLAGGGGGDLLDLGAALGGEIGVISAALDVDRIDLGADVGGGRADQPR